VTPPRRRYATDLTDREWALLAPMIPKPKPGGRPAVHDRRELVNAMLYWLRSGCAWRLLPHAFPPWQTVYHYWRAWRCEGRWERLLGVLRARKRPGRAACRPQVGRSLTARQGVAQSADLGLLPVHRLLRNRPGTRIATGGVVC
jgi:putative transposase